MVSKLQHQTIYTMRDFISHILYLLVWFTDCDLKTIYVSFLRNSVCFIFQYGFSWPWRKLVNTVLMFKEDINNLTLYHISMDKYVLCSSNIKMDFPACWLNSCRYCCSLLTVPCWCWITQSIALQQFLIKSYPQICKLLCFLCKWLICFLICQWRGCFSIDVTTSCRVFQLEDLCTKPVGAAVRPGST